MFVANVDIKNQISKYIYSFARNEEARNSMSIRILFDSNKFTCLSGDFRRAAASRTLNAGGTLKFYLTQIKFASRSLSPLDRCR